MDPRLRDMEADGNSKLAGVSAESDDRVIEEPVGLAISTSSDLRQDEDSKLMEQCDENVVIEAECEARVEGNREKVNINKQEKDKSIEIVPKQKGGRKRIRCRVCIETSLW